MTVNQRQVNERFLMKFGVYRKKFLLEDGISNRVPYGKDLTGYPGDSRMEGIILKMENASNKKDVKGIRNIAILLREHYVWKNLTSGLTEIEIHICFLDTGLFEDIVRPKCSFA